MCCCVVNGKDGEHVDGAVRHNERKQAAALVVHHREDEADGDRKDYLDKRLGKRVAGEQVYDVANPKGY